MCCARVSSEAMLLFRRRSDGLEKVVAYTIPLTVTVADEDIPATVRTPAFAVMDPVTVRDWLPVMSPVTSRVLPSVEAPVTANVVDTVTAPVFEMPLTVKVPAEAVIEPRMAVVTYIVGTVTVADDEMPATVKVPAEAVIDPNCAVVT